MTKKSQTEAQVSTGQTPIGLTGRTINPPYELTGQVINPSHDAVRIINPSYTPVVGVGGIAFGSSVNLLSASETDISELRREIAAAKSQLSESQKQILSLQKQFTEKVSKSQLSELVANIQSLSESIEVTQKRIEQAQDRSNQLTAPLILPTPEDMKIGLVPTHWLDRLEEYRSDENFVNLLIGLFGGAFLGMLGAAFLSPKDSFSTYAIAFLILLLVITISCIVFLSRIRKRTNELRQKMNNFSLPQDKTAK